MKKSRVDGGGDGAPLGKKKKVRLQPDDAEEFHMDPSEAPESSRHTVELRMSYRQLIQGIKDNRDDLLSHPDNKLTRLLQEADRLFKNVRRVTEAALDAQLLALATELAKEKATQICARSSFEPSVFSEHLLSFMGLNPLEEEEEEEQPDSWVFQGYLPRDAWQRLAGRVQCCFMTAPSFHFMQGLFSATPPTPKKKMKKSSCKEAKRIMPTQLLQLECPHETTEKEVERILGYLKGYYRDDPTSPIIYYEFVIDPDSFTRTVENIFHTSFLIRDGFARLYLSDSNLPCIEPMEEGNMVNEDSFSKKQCIITLSPKLWKELIDVLEIKTAMIQPPKP